MKFFSLLKNSKVFAIPDGSRVSAERQYNLNHCLRSHLETLTLSLPYNAFLVTPGGTGHTAARCRNKVVQPFICSGSNFLIRLLKKNARPGVLARPPPPCPSLVAGSQGSPVLPLLLSEGQACQRPYNAKFSSHVRTAAGRARASFSASQRRRGTLILRPTTGGHYSKRLSRIRLPIVSANLTLSCFPATRSKANVEKVSAIKTFLLLPPSVYQLQVQLTRRAVEEKRL